MDNSALDLGNSLIEDEDALGDWPRRLLHVPTMTSFEWAPGNYYGSFEEPDYIATSYTWGRWALRDHEMPEVKAIEISGVSWEIPRIHPARFTRDQFLDFIRNATDPRPHEESQVEFLWLDVACIDQRSSEPASAAEVGRQAHIFKGACKVSVWLNDTELWQLEAMRDTFRRIMPDHADPNGPWAHVVDATGLPVEEIAEMLHKTLSELFSDAWFSSLWTLQEALLFSLGQFFSKDGTMSTFGLDDFKHFYQRFELALLDTERDPAPEIPGLWTRSVSLVHRVGMYAHITNNPLEALTQAVNRKTTKEEDQIYGIQQLFRFRLGITAPGYTGKPFSRAELEFQFGQSLMEAYPILSQLHVFTQPVKFGQGWRINDTSRVAQLYSLGALDPVHQSKTMCKLSTVVLSDGVWGHFTGIACPFRTLSNTAQQLDRDPNFREHPLYGNDYKDISILEAYLDASDYVQSSPEFRGGTLYQAPSGDRQRTLVSWLAREFPPADLHVVVLGERALASEKKMYGLLLLRERSGISDATGKPLERWRRLGYCAWWFSRPYSYLKRPINPRILRVPPGSKTVLVDTASETAVRIFQCASCDWVKLSGYFG